MRYQHDCSGCKALGEFGDADLYFCKQNIGGATVIARFSDEGGDYTSGLAGADFHPELREAKKRAEEQGFLGSSSTVAA